MDTERRAGGSGVVKADQHQRRKEWRQ